MIIAQICNSHGFPYAWKTSKFHHEVFREITKQIEELYTGECIIVDDTWLANIANEDAFVSMYPNVSRENVEHIFFVNIVDPKSTTWHRSNRGKFQNDLQQLTTAKHSHSIITKSKFQFWAYWCQHVLRKYEVEGKVRPWSGDKLFLAYNRKPQPFRVALVDAFKAHGLMDSGAVTLGHKDPTKALTVQESYDVSDKDIDGFVGIPNDITSIGNPDIWESALVNVVSETTTIGEFLSEKIWKPIVGKRPFLLLGPPGSLRRLQDLGFKTFGEFWDESYNDVIYAPGHLDDDKSIEAICQILTKLKTYSPSHIKHMYNRMYYILEHNHNHFFNEFTRLNYDRIHTIVKDEM